MTVKSPAIVLNAVKYRETSLIVRVVTEELGQLSLLVNSVRTKKPRFSPSLFQPLSLLDVVFYYKEGRDIHRVSEAKNRYVFSEIPFDIKKSSLAMFLTELLAKLTREGGANSDLFEFLSQAIYSLDNCTKGLGHFHVSFLYQLATQLGIQPQGIEELLSELKNAQILPPPLSPNDKALFDALVEKELGEAFPMDASLRQTFLTLMLKYFQSQLQSLGTFRSLEVLREVFH